MLLRNALLAIIILLPLTHALLSSSLQANEDKDEGTGPITALGLDPIVSSVPKIGVVGDSLSDEYSTYPYGIMERNWTVMLEDTGYGELGDFQTFRLDSRLYGYEFNWARAGAQTSDVIDEGQTIGLALQIANQKVEVALMLIGANDFGAAYDEIYNGEWTEDQMGTFMNGLKSNLTNIVETIAVAEPPILILCTIPDLGDTPLYRYGAHPDAEKRALVTELIKEANQTILDLAETHQAAIIDVYSWFKIIVENPQYRYLGFWMQSNSGGLEPGHLFTIDRFHPGTLAQSQLANMILSTIEDERVRLVNAQITTYNEEKSAIPTEPAFVPVGPITAQDREIPNSTIFLTAGVERSADIYFPNSIYAGPAKAVVTSPWLGVLAVESFPWINHLHHGWLYCDGYGGKKIRFWDSHLGWLQTTSETYPTFIRESDGHELVYQIDSSEPRKFLDKTDQIMLDIPYGATTSPEE